MVPICSRADRRSKAALCFFDTNCVQKSASPTGEPKIYILGVIDICIATGNWDKSQCPNSSHFLKLIIK